MPGRGGETSMGGAGRGFEQTHWSLIVRAQGADGARKQGALAALVGEYWKPVYCYLRRKGYDNEAAKDLTQGFVADVLVGGELVRAADPGKGRFRAFLLTALDRYVASARRAERAKKRAPAGALVSLEGLDGFELADSVHDASPDAAFDYAWASALLDDVLAELRAECLASGKAAHWEVFHGRVLLPVFEEAAPVPLPALCRRLGIEAEAKASNMLVTAKRRFQALLRRRVGQSIGPDEDPDDVIGDLIRSLSLARAGPGAEPRI
ncbi:MAG: sigma-70 family RNA polymerase sigma factor [Planctomycetes bacterium]|nr:sigma-70 family RNA polymerase sigma factor [Planctomycetota bacterium]